MWVLLEIGIAIGYTISPSPFVMAMQILLKAANIPNAHIGKGLHMPPIKAFMDETILIKDRNKLNILLMVSNGFQTCEIQESRVCQGEIRRNVFFDKAGPRIPTVSNSLVD